MNFEPTDEQRQLADSLQKVLANDYSFDKRRAILASDTGSSDKIWATLADMGLTALALPEADGGFGGGALDLLAAMQACGDALLVEPLLDNLLAARLLARAGSAEQRATLLPGVVDGSLKLAFAGLEPGSRYDLAPSTTLARQQGSGWVLDGEKCVVIGAAVAGQLLVSARTAEGADGVSLFLVEPGAVGVTLNHSRTVDGQRAADVRLAGVLLGARA